MTTTTYTTTADQVRTPDQLKADFIYHGQTISAWAESNGYSRITVYKVINGMHKGILGKGHEIAVRLRLKAGTVTIGSAAA